MITRTFDLPILDWIAEHFWSPFGDAVMPLITMLGDGGWFWIVLALVLLCMPKYRKTGLAMGLALLIGLVICNLYLKPVIGRLRPFDYQWQCYGRVILLLRSKKWGIPAMILAALIAFSRLYLYVHYPTDVLAAMVLGIGIAFLSTYLINKLTNRNHKENHYV